MSHVFEYFYFLLTTAYFNSYNNHVSHRVRKILNTKIFTNDTGKKWSASIMDKQYEILCVSQFTLYHTLKGNKLDFHNAMPAPQSEPFYMNFLSELGKKYKPEMIKGIE